ASPPAANFSRASLSRWGRRKLPTWSARNGGRGIGSSQRAVSKSEISIVSRRWRLWQPGRLGSAPRGEEGFQHRGGFTFPYTAVHVWRVMAGRLAEEARPVFDRAALRVGR